MAAPVYSNMEMSLKRVKEEESVGVDSRDWKAGCNDALTEADPARAVDGFAVG